jgi:CRISPR-associated endonuclease Cas2
MATRHKYFILMYDITQASALQKTGKLLEQNGYVRINYSVWLGYFNPLQMDELKNKLNMLLDSVQAKGSVLYVIPIGRNELVKMRDIYNKKPKELAYWIGEQKTMFF